MKLRKRLTNSIGISCNGSHPKSRGVCRQHPCAIRTFQFVGVTRCLYIRICNKPIAHSEYQLCLLALVLIFNMPSLPAEQTLCVTTCQTISRQHLKNKQTQTVLWPLPNYHFNVVLASWQAKHIANSADVDTFADNKLPPRHTAVIPRDRPDAFPGTSFARPAVQRVRQTQESPGVASWH